MLLEVSSITAKEDLCSRALVLCHTPSLLWKRRFRSRIEGYNPKMVGTPQKNSAIWRPGIIVWCRYRIKWKDREYPNIGISVSIHVCSQNNCFLRPEFGFVHRWFTWMRQATLFENRLTVAKKTAGFPGFYRLRLGIRSGKFPFRCRKTQWTDYLRQARPRRAGIRRLTGRQEKQSSAN